MFFGDGFRICWSEGSFTRGSWVRLSNYFWVGNGWVKLGYFWVIMGQGYRHCGGGHVLGGGGYPTTAWIFLSRISRHWQFTQIG